MTRFAAVIFDMDGVLIDSEPLHFEVLNEVLASEGEAISRADNEEFIGTTTETLWTALIARRQLAHTREEYETRYDAAVLRVLARPHPAAPGAAELARHLRRLGTRLAVASSSRRTWVAATLRSIGLDDAFDAWACGDEVARGKPDPEIYLLAARRLGVPAEQCLAIEDAPNGVLSAARAGMAVLGVRTPYTAHLPLDGAQRVVDSLTELDLHGDPFTTWP
ncbi:MAG: HAD family phosphatase [Chloroflexota bacterium]|nr:HAD family phosphatase [Chloroflexota bacterium]